MERPRGAPQEEDEEPERGGSTSTSNTTPFTAGARLETVDRDGMASAMAAEQPLTVHTPAPPREEAFWSCSSLSAIYPHHALRKAHARLALDCSQLGEQQRGPLKASTHPSSSLPCTRFLSLRRSTAVATSDRGEGADIAWRHNTLPQSGVYCQPEVSQAYWARHLRKSRILRLSRRKTPGHPAPPAHSTVRLIQGDLIALIQGTLTRTFSQQQQQAEGIFMTVGGGIS